MSWRELAAWCAAWSRANVGERCMAGDLWVLADGTVVRRRASRSHVITRHEALAAAEGAQTLVIGTGCLGRAVVKPEVEVELTKRSIKLVVRTTPDACRAFNAASTPRAAILHCAC